MKLEPGTTCSNRPPVTRGSTALTLVFHSPKHAGVVRIRAFKSNGPKTIIFTMQVMYLNEGYESENLHNQEL